MRLLSYPCGSCCQGWIPTPRRVCVSQSLLEQLLCLLEQGREVAAVLGLLESFVQLGGKRQVASQFHRIAQAMAPRVHELLSHLSQQPQDPPGASPGTFRGLIDIG